MKTSFFKPNWREINKAIESGSLKELRTVQKDLEKKIQARVNAFFRAKKLKEIEDHKAELKSLVPGQDVYFIGYSKRIPFGQKCEKLSDGRVRMHFKVGLHSIFNCTYDLLSLTEPTAEELKSHKILVHITNIANKVFNRDIS